MFPHTVTLYLPRAETDPETLVDRITCHITVLRGVLLDAGRAVRVRGAALEGADAAVLRIPFSVEAADGVTGRRRTYAEPAEFFQAADRSGLWTLLDGEDCFFVKGETVKPEEGLEQLEAEHDGVYLVSRVRTRDFGALRHWEVEGK